MDFNLGDDINIHQHRKLQKARRRRNKKITNKKKVQLSKCELSTEDQDMGEFLVYSSFPIH